MHQVTKNVFQSTNIIYIVSRFIVVDRFCIYDIKFMDFRNVQSITIFHKVILSTYIQRSANIVLDAMINYTI